MPDILSSLSEQLKVFSHRPIVLAYSGGVDSQVLLHALVTIKQQYMPAMQLSVCHVNHGLSENASSWQSFAEQTCHAYNVPLVCKSVSLKKQSRQSIEAIAREARYKALSELSSENAVVLTGHHQDDQWETFLLAVKRGSGVQGLSAMQSSQPFTASRTLYRPLLNHSRAEIESYARLQDLTWIEDESNQDIRFDRNFVRHEVTPKLIERWPAFLKTVSRTVELCQNSQQILAEVAEEDFNSCLSANKRLMVNRLRDFSRARQQQIIRFFLARKAGLMPSQAQLDQALIQLAQPDASMLSIKLGNLWLRQFLGELYLTETLSDVSQWYTEVALPISHSDIKLPDHLGTLQIAQDNADKAEWDCVFSLPDDISLLQVKFTHNNPKVLPDYRQHHRALKKIWQELAVPTWQRNRIPLIFINDELIAAPGYFVCQPFLPNQHKQTYYLNWLTASVSG